MLSLGVALASDLGVPGSQADCRRLHQRFEVRILGGWGRAIFFTAVATSRSQEPPRTVLGRHFDPERGRVRTAWACSAGTGGFFGRGARRWAGGVELHHGCDLAAVSEEQVVRCAGGVALGTPPEGLARPPARFWHAPQETWHAPSTLGTPAGRAAAGGRRRRRPSLGVGALSRSSGVAARVNGRLGGWVVRESRPERITRGP